MVKLLDFPIVVSVAALAAYFLAGGLGLMLTGLVGLVWRIGGFQSTAHGPHTLAMLPKSIKKLQESQTTPPAARPPYRFFVDVALCIAFIVVGIMRLDSKGIIISIG